MKNFYEMLGVNRVAEAPEISQAYRRLLQEQYQEMGKEADLPSLSQAHKTLTNPAKRRDYDARLDLLSGQFMQADPDKPTKAEQAYLDGLKAFEAQNYQEAVQYFARAARLDPNQGHYFSQWGLSIGMFPGRLPEAELYCKKAIELDPDNPVFYFNLGFLYQRHNLSEPAQQSFAKAQEAQQVRQAKYSALALAPIAASWRGDADSLLKELDSIEQTIGQLYSDPPQVISLPQAGDLSPKSQTTEEPVPAAEPEPEQLPAEVPTPNAQAPSGSAPVSEPLPAPAEEAAPEELSGVDDLLSELDSLESSIEKVETLRDGRIPSEPEETPLESVSPQQQLVPQEPAEDRPTHGETQAQSPEQPEGSKLEIVTARDELVSRASEELAHDHELQREAESLGESPLDLLKELDSIESMVAGIEQAGRADQPEEIPEQYPRQSSSVPEPPPPAESASSGPSSEQLEDEAMELLKELDLPAAVTRPEPEAPPDEGDLDIKQKMERLNRIEEQMMEELLKLKAERERLREDLKV